MVANNPLIMIRGRKGACHPVIRGLLGLQNHGPRRTIIRAFDCRSPRSSSDFFSAEPIIHFLFSPPTGSLYEVLPWRAEQHLSIWSELT